MLTLQPTEPFWIGEIPGSEEDPRPFLIPGVRVKMRPIGPKAFRAAQIALVEVLARDGADDWDASDALSAELIRRGLVEWEGVGDANGAVVPVTPLSAEQFAADPRTFLPANKAYVMPWLDRDAEGNVFAGSPNGTGAAATPANITASSPAAAPTAPAATAARTSRTSAKRKKAKPSGR